MKMYKRVIAVLICIIIFVSSSCGKNNAAVKFNNDANNPFILQVLFGDEQNVIKYESNEKIQTLLSALYLCCEQCDNRGQDILDYLKAQKIKNLPVIDELNINNDELIKYVCVKWVTPSSIREARRNLLTNTVKSVLNSKKCDINPDQFAVLIYYLDLLVTYYVKDDLKQTGIAIEKDTVPSYTGNGYISLNNGNASFSQKDISNKQQHYSPMDELGRCRYGFVYIDHEMMLQVGDRPNLSNIRPSGWNQEKYKEIIGSETDPGYLYERCHLIARRFTGYDEKNNLITGTRYLNKTMGIFEDRVAQYLEDPSNEGNHVLYRVTPIYNGNNPIASGVQMEAYSVEDNGALNFNVFCYNVQTGIQIDYTTGKSQKSVFMQREEWPLPFAQSGVSANDPDLLLEIRAALELVFEAQKSSSLYIGLIGQLDTYSEMLRSLDPNNIDNYWTIRQCQQEYLNELIYRIPELLRKSGFIDAIAK